MRLWRISNYADLTGTGGLFASARWHSKGRRLVYLAESPASALLERIVHLEIDPADLPTGYQLIAIDIPDTVSFEHVALEKLATDWRENLTVTRTHGDRWLAGGNAALLRVPSALVPLTSNWLLNPTHPDAAKARIAEIIPAPFDPRFFGPV
jgi:RES domain-containing protein